MFNSKITSRLRRFVSQVAVCAVAVSFMAGANAGLVGVKSVEISNSINEWLQVAEFQAFDMSNVNVALTATASAPDSWSASSTPPSMGIRMAFLPMAVSFMKVIQKQVIR